MGGSPHGNGPCGPLHQVGTGIPSENSAFCSTTPGPGQLDLFIYQGDDWRRTIRWESPPGTPATDLTAAAVKIQVRDGFEVNEPDVLFEASVGDGVTITDGPNATFEVYFSSAKTVLLNGSTPFYYDLQVTPSGGDLTTILKGRVYFDLQVTT